jgi:hypothetical protein
MDVRSTFSIDAIVARFIPALSRIDISFLNCARFRFLGADEGVKAAGS